MRSLATLALAAGLAPLASPALRAPFGPQFAQESAYPDVIESLRDVLPPSLYDRLGPELGRELVGADQPVYLLINPLLRGESGSPEELRRALTLPGTELSSELFALLGKRDEQSPTAQVYRQLERVFDDYLGLFFKPIQKGASLQGFVQYKREKRMILVSVDAQTGVRAGQLEVKVWMRLWRLEFSLGAPFAVKSAEMLYSDRAIGRAALPVPAASGHSEYAVFAAFRTAVIDAIRGQLALSLWGDPALLSARWTEERSDPITAGAPVSPGAPPAGSQGAQPGAAAPGSQRREGQR